MRKEQGQNRRSKAEEPVSVTLTFMISRVPIPHRKCEPHTSAEEWAQRVVGSMLETSFWLCCSAAQDQDRRPPRGSSRTSYR
jgi:hypothetical protein